MEGCWPSGANIAGLGKVVQPSATGVAMKLYYTPGTSSLFPHIVLHEAGLAFEKIKVDEHTKLMDKWQGLPDGQCLGFRTCAWAR